MTLQPESRAPRDRGLTPWDVRAASGGAALAFIFAALAVLLTAATDEGGLSWGERAARSLPVTPLCAAVATAIQLAGSQRRGEARALEALGRSPFGNVLGAVIGASALGLLAGALVLADERISVHPFFPTVHAVGQFRFESGVFSNTTAGWRVMADGTLALLAPEAAPSATDADPSGLPRHARGAAALLTVLGSSAFALAAARSLGRGRAPTSARAPSPAARTAFAMLVTAAASVFCLQAAAAGRLPPLLATVPSTVLLLGTAWAIFRPAWR